MNILQTIWSALTTQNETLINFIAIPLTYLDIYIGMFFFTILLNIKTSKVKKLIYVLFYGTVSIIINFTIPATYKIFLNMILWPLMVFFIFRTTLLKSILSEAIVMVTTSILDSLIINILTSICNISLSNILQIPIYRIISALTIYFIMFLITKLINIFKISINILDNMHSKSKILLIINTLLMVIVIAMQFYLITFYSNTMPLFITIISIIALIAYFSLSIYSIVGSSKLECTTRDLESANHTIQTTKILHDQVRSFKHDFDNIVNGIGGYIVNNDMQGLKRYYAQLLEECNKTNNLYALSPDVINHPAIYHMLATKYYEADKLDVEIKLNVFLNLNEIEDRMKIYDFTRILGILLDNAIDAAKECDKKILNVTFRKDITNDMILVIIQNTYSNKNVNTEEIYQKGVSSKENHSGLGLWKVRQILMHNNNLNLYTTKDNEFFTQQFEIYK